MTVEDVTPPAAPPAAPPADPPAAPPPADPPVPPAEPPTPSDPPPAAPPAAPVVPDKYDLKLPDNTTLDPSVLERTAATARALGLSNEAAQKLVDSVAQEAATLLDAQTAAIDEQAKTWKAETLADVTLGKTPEERTAAIQRGHNVVDKYVAANPTDGETFKAFLNGSALGNHPAANRFFAWLGSAMGEGSLQLPGSTSGDSEEAQLARRYPTMVPKT